MAKARVLVVEDEANLREAIWEILEWSGYEPAEAGGGSAGLAKAERWRPDVILLDVWMPEQDGYDVCRRLKANPRTTHIPVIFMTAGKRETVTRLASEVGAAACLTKPFGIAPLVALIKEVLADPARRVQPEAKVGEGSDDGRDS